MPMRLIKTGDAWHRPYGKIVGWHRPYGKIVGWHRPYGKIVGWHGPRGKGRCMAPPLGQDLHS
jgi:hypothetical protein